MRGQLWAFLAAARSVACQPLHQRYYAYAAIFALFYWLFMLFAPGYYYFGRSHFTDLIIPVEAGLAWQNGLELHTEFYSPFGILYFAHHGIALALTELLLGDGWLVFDVWVTAYFLMWLLIMAAMFLFTRLLHCAYPVWFLFVVCIVMMNTGMPDMSSNTGWYEPYNTGLTTLYVAAAFAAWLRHNVGGGGG